METLSSDIYDITMCCKTQRLVGQARSVGERDFNSLEDSLCLSLPDASASLSPPAVCTLSVLLILPVIVRCHVRHSGQLVLVSQCLRNQSVCELVDSIIHEEACVLMFQAVCQLWWLACSQLGQFVRKSVSGFHVVVIIVGLVWWWLVQMERINAFLLYTPNHQNWNFFIVFSLC